MGRVTSRHKVVRIDLDKDLAGWRPEKGRRDKHGREIEDRIYNQRDYDRNLVLEKRTQLVAHKVTEFLRATDRMSKCIVFCITSASKRAICTVVIIISFVTYYDRR